ncbi:MAG: YvcK family protein [Bryobacterales bacterium]|nr:YvcK family protein [Bryobacterales bacterium]MBV9399713.1 YvcK family protein [Bryobacterales bacterium]
MANGAYAPLRIVSMGGGTGLATLLRGLKRYTKILTGPVELTAIVTVTDDGGSSGRLRREFAVLPPGDIRNCMVALSEDEALLSRLFQYRFAGAGSLHGHSFGNLFLTAMTHLTGDFGQAVKLSSEVLAVAGRIYPCTSANVVLEATLANGGKVRGETRISKSNSEIRTIALRPASAKPLPETLNAIAQADLITLGPGSLFTSVIPNLLIDGIPNALAASPALKAYFANLMTQPGETTNLKASDHVAAVFRHCGPRRRRLVDVCVINDRPFSRKALAKYRAGGAQPVEADLGAIQRMGVRVLAADLLRLNGQRAEDKIRHDSTALAAVAIDLAQQGRRRKRKSA